MKAPTNVKVELQVLGGMMNSKEALFEGVAQLDVDYFTTDETISIFKSIVEQSTTGRVSRTVLEKVATTQKEKALIQSADSTYKDIDGFKLDLETIKNTYLNRQLYYITNKVTNAITENVDAKQTIELLSDSISQLYFNDEGTNIIDPSQYADEALVKFIEGLDNPDNTYGLRFSVNVKGKVLGFPGLDEVFRGAQGGDLFLLAAKTGEGKTALANNIARIFSLYQKHAGYYENTEMKVDELLHRLIAPLSNVSVNEIAHSQIEGTKEERDRKVKAVENAIFHFKSSKLYLSRIPVLTATKAKALAKQVRNKYGELDYLIVDYIGRMDLEYSKGMQEWQVMFKIIQQMKELAMELDIPVFVLSQRNDEGKIEGAKKIANECDGVLFFEPITENDKDAISNSYLDADKRDRVNYKITKRKIRRSSNTFPIWCEFDKDKQFINEVI